MKTKPKNQSSPFEIDKTRLDEAWIEQPKLAETYLKKYAQAKLDLEYAKTALDVKEAELSKKIRNNPDRYDIGKVTEKAISEELTIRLAKTVEAKALIQTKFEVDMIWAAVTRTEHRKRALQDLVQMWSMGYFSDPKEPRNIDREAMTNMKEKAAIRKTRMKG